MEGYRVWLRNLFGATEEPDPGPFLPNANAHSSERQSFADDNNDFALAMYGQLRQSPGNLFFSPFSIRTALGMTQAGAKGETAAQMSNALRIAASDTAHIAFGEAITRLNAAAGGKYEMAVANSLWAQDGAPPQPGFLDLVARHYGGGMNLVDFRHSAEAARVAINRSVEDKTRHKIREVIPSGGLSALARLVVVNAVYFKGRWALQFRRAATREEPFHLERGGTVKAPLMHQQQEVRYLKAAGFQAVDLVYRGGDLSMLLILPDRTDGLLDLQKTLSVHMLRDCMAQMSVREINLFLPRFTFTWGTVDIRDQLAALGMALAFKPFQADFSGINGQEPPSEEALFIANVFHKTFVEVNEEGTEAAAATAAGLMLGALGPPTPVPLFRADHPFLFAIGDRKSGAVLFLGHIADPTRES